MARIVPVQSTCPCTMCPSNESPTFRDGSRFIFVPAVHSFKLVVFRVSAEILTIKCSLHFFATVRQTPEHAIELPSLILRKSSSFWVLIHAVISDASVLATSIKYPIAVTIPLNKTPPYLDTPLVSHDSRRKMASPHLCSADFSCKEWPVKSK